MWLWRSGPTTRVLPVWMRQAGCHRYPKRRIMSPGFWAHLSISPLSSLGVIRVGLHFLDLIGMAFRVGRHKYEPSVAVDRARRPRREVRPQIVLCLFDVIDIGVP